MNLNDTDPDSLGKAKVFLETLPLLPNGDIDRLYLHWSAEGYCTESSSYNAMVILDNDQWIVKTEHDVKDNARSTYNPQNYAEHTWRRNTGAFGICISGMDGANVDSDNFGADGPQEHELQLLCAAAGAIAYRYKIDVSGKFQKHITHWDNTNANLIDMFGEVNTLTHAEVAVIDNYPDERWDLGTLEPIKEPLTSATRTQSGNTLRSLIHAYKLSF
jgi:hypothetical protein